MDHQWNPMGGFQPQTTQHHHHTAHNAAGQATAQYVATPDQEVAVARTQMFESVHHLSVALRNAASQCDNFVKTVARLHPSAAATTFAANTGADFLALASGGVLGAGSLTHASVPGLTDVTIATGTPGRKPLTKEERKARKKDRDPNAPKRPASAYLLYQNETRKDMRQRHKDLSYKEVLGKISQAWHSLTPEERKVYQDRMTDNLEEWQRAKRTHQGGEATADVETYNDAEEDVGEQPVHMEADGEDAAAAAAVADAAAAAAAAGEELLSTNGSTTTAVKAGSRKAGGSVGGAKAEKRSRRN